jgi:hypothetical protein
MNEMLRAHSIYGEDRYTEGYGRNLQQIIWKTQVQLRG